MLRPACGDAGAGDPGRLARAVRAGVRPGDRGASRADLRRVGSRRGARGYGQRGGRHRGGRAVAGDRRWPGASARRGPHAAGLLGAAASGRNDRQRDAGRRALVGASGEIVLDQDTAHMLGKRVGDMVGVYEPFEPGVGKPGLPVPDDQRWGGGAPRVEDPQLPPPVVSAVVVGIAGSVSTPDVAAWLSPRTSTWSRRRPPRPGDALPRRAVRHGGGPGGRDRDITAGLPAGAMVGRVTYLDVRAGVNDTADLYVPSSSRSRCSPCSRPRSRSRTSSAGSS